MKTEAFQFLVVLSTVQWAVTLGASECSGPRCDFVCDCTDCSDEHYCGYHGSDFTCDFEEAGTCGWTDKSPELGSTWERRQRGDPLPDSGPSSDYTIGTSTGWFMAVTAVKGGSPSSAVLMSPVMNQSSPTCRLRLHYFMWDSGSTGLGNSTLWGSVWRPEGQEAVVWRPEGLSVRAWREDTIFLGRIPGPFHIRLHSLRREGRRGDVAVDQLEFLDCALPASGGCGLGYLKCKRGGCVEERAACDGTDDCGDGTDEEGCGQHMSCDFEDGLCNWDLRSLSQLKWIRTSQKNMSVSEPWRGPGRDHSTNSISGHFLYVTKKAGLKADWSSFQSPRLAPTNSTHPCRMVMYTHQFGRVAGGLSILVAEKEIYPVWERGGALGDLWVKAEVQFVVNSTFQILFVAAIRDHAYGGVAVDDITLSPECRLSNESMPWPTFPRPPKHPCTEDSKTCDFQEDCIDGEDEAQCGDFSYEQGGKGWTDASIGSQRWQLNHSELNITSTEMFLYVTEAPGQQLTEAQTRTPLLGPSGPACTLHLSYRLTGSNPHIGEVSIAVVDSMLGPLPWLWEFSGRTGESPASWLKEEVYIGARDHRFQLEFRARAQNLGSDTEIAVKDVYYVNCHPHYIPSTGELSCDFEKDLCGWYQDQMDNYDWRVDNETDHTTGTGRGLVVDMWDPTLRDLSGRLLSLRQNMLTQHCLTFFYKLYGPQTGVLNVKVLYADGSEVLLWTRGGAHGNLWHKGHCPVPPQLTTYQLVFEAVRTGFDGQVVVDDVEFVHGQCSMPAMCSFEGHFCGYSRSGAALWVHQSWLSARSGPKTDHSLDTEMGYYMVAHSGVEVLPQGGVMTLTSPLHRSTAPSECVHFWYQTGGQKPGTLSVYVKPLKGGRMLLFSNSLNQEDIWYLVMANISCHGDWQLEFEVKGAGGARTYIAVDDITFSNHSCPTTDEACDLERGMCGWTNTQNHFLDRLDWELSSPLTETHYPTPPYDHTLGNKNGHFLFLPSSSRDTAGQNAWLLSPHLPPTKGTCLQFWAYQSADSDSRLRVWRLTGGVMDEIVSLNQAEESWRHFHTNITSEREYQIVFEGHKGIKGVLALDDFGYTVGVNCAGEHIDQTPSPSPDSAVVVAFSVVLAVLVVVAACGSLVFYLRKRKQLTGRPQGPSCEVSHISFFNDLYNSTPTVQSPRLS